MPPHKRSSDSKALIHRFASEYFSMISNRAVVYAAALFYDMDKWKDIAEN